MYRKLCKSLLSDKINNGGFSCGKKEKNSMKQLLDERGIKDVAGVQAMMNELINFFDLLTLCRESKTVKKKWTHK